MAARLLVVAPHPDDESLGAGGLMAKARHQGDDVYVVLLTSGDGFVEDAARYYLSLDVKPEEYVHMGYERQMETERAMATLGIPARNLFFLGFPDGGIDALWRTHWDRDPWVSATTGFDRVPYLTAWRPDMPYLGRRLLDLLVAVYEEVRPTRIVLPSAFDTHPDHWGTNAFATMAWAELARRNRLWEGVARLGYLVHWPTWPLPLSYRPESAAEAPRPLRRLGQEPWHVEEIDRKHVEQKRLALMAHTSQAELIKPFMLAFCRRTETFTEEHRWSGHRRASVVQVANPDTGWFAQAFGRGNPLAGVRWLRRGDNDGADVWLRPGTPADSRIEINITVADAEPRHFRWMIGDGVPAGIGVSRQHDHIMVRWPRNLIGHGARFLAGAQIYHLGKCEGKVPFRPIDFTRMSPVVDSLHGRMVAWNEPMAP